MIEEPYRWVEAISNRREYVEHQIAGGSPVVAVSCREGVLFVTVGRERQKIFEIYDRIAMGGIGHPGDLERLRMAAIEVTGTEGFTRSADDVSLRRLANYSLSPALKSAFEQVYGAPYLARMLFAELGRENEPDLFIRIEYDGSLHTNGGFGKAWEAFGVISGTRPSTLLMERFLQGKKLAECSRSQALEIALDAWAVGHSSLREEIAAELPSPEAIAGYRREQLEEATIEAALLDRTIPVAMKYRVLSDKELAAAGGKRE